MEKERPKSMTYAPMAQWVVEKRPAFPKWNGAQLIQAAFKNSTKVITLPTSLEEDQAQQNRSQSTPSQSRA